MLRPLALSALAVAKPVSRDRTFEDAQNDLADLGGVEARVMNLIEAANLVYQSELVSMKSLRQFLRFKRSSDELAQRAKATKRNFDDFAKQVQQEASASKADAQYGLVDAKDAFIKAGASIKNYSATSVADLRLIHAAEALTE